RRLRVRIVLGRPQHCLLCHQPSPAPLAFIGTHCTNGFWCLAYQCQHQPCSESTHTIAFLFCAPQHASLWPITSCQSGALKPASSHAPECTFEQRQKILRKHGYEWVESHGSPESLESPESLRVLGLVRGVYRQGTVQTDSGMGYALTTFSLEKPPPNM